jgi:hypothetical protein
VELTMCTPVRTASRQLQPASRVLATIDLVIRAGHRWY